MSKLLLFFFVSLLYCNEQRTKQTFVGQKIILNQNFKPMIYLGPKEYSNSEMRHWTVNNHFYFHISDWKTVYPKCFVNSTLLIMSLMEYRNYSQRITLSTLGRYELWAVIFIQGLHQKETIRLRITWCNHYYWTSPIGQLHHPKMLYLLNIIIDYQESCNFIIHQEKIKKRTKNVYSPITIYLSDLHFLVFKNQKNSKVNEKSFLTQLRDEIYCCQTNIIKNQNFKPFSYIGPQEYPDYQVPSWHQQEHSSLLISDWKTVFPSAIFSTTLLVMSFKSRRIYSQNISFDYKGQYQLWALTFVSGLAFQQKFKLRIKWCERLYYTQFFNNMFQPEMKELLKIYAQVPQKCELVIYQTIISPQDKIKTAPIQLFLSKLTFYFVPTLTSLSQKLSNFAAQVRSKLYSFCNFICRRSMKQQNAMFEA